MTDKPWGIVLSLGIGSIIGSIAGIFISKKIRIKEDNTPSIQEVTEFYEEKIKDILQQNTPKATPGETLLNKLNDPEFRRTTIQNAIEKAKNEANLEADGTPMNPITHDPHKQEKDYIPYSKQYKMKDGTEVVIDNREEIKLDPYPHKITMDEYYKDKNYSKTTLIYYEQDSMFATPGDEPTDYTEDYFGIHNISEFGATTNSGYGHDSWTLVLRDEITKSDFQILYEGNKSWEEVWQNTGGEKD